MTVKKQWKKILYENQPYPDNYTDESFLRDLRTNIKPVSLQEAIWGATLLLEEFCTVIAFVLVYIYLFNEWIEPDSIFSCSSTLTIIGFILYRLIYTQKEFQVQFGHDLRTVLIFIVFGHLFSPVLHTLTDTISTDTIYTMTFFMMIVHLIFFDYSVSAAIVSNGLSLSAAIFASICLASRLASAYHAFILIAVAIELFVLFPLFRSKVRRSLYIVSLLFICDVYFLMKSSQLFMFIFILTAVFINIACPYLFVEYQKHKSNIYGPWDEAIVDDADGVITGLNANFLQNN